MDSEGPSGQTFSEWLDDLIEFDHLVHNQPIWLFVEAVRWVDRNGGITSEWNQLFKAARRCYTIK